MKIQFVLEFETPDVALHGADVQTDLRQLVLDIVQLTLCNYPTFSLRTERIKEGKTASARMMTKAEVAQYTGMSTRNVERCVKGKKLPEPIRIAAPHCANGAPRWFAQDIHRHD